MGDRILPRLNLLVSNESAQPDQSAAFKTYSNLTVFVYVSGPVDLGVALHKKCWDNLPEPLCELGVSLRLCGKAAQHNT
jgi:hypothetical protein